MLLQRSCQILLTNLNKSLRSKQKDWLFETPFNLPNVYHVIFECKNQFVENHLTFFCSFSIIFRVLLYGFKRLTLPIHFILRIYCFISGSRSTNMFCIVSNRSLETCTSAIFACMKIHMLKIYIFPGTTAG